MFPDPMGARDHDRQHGAPGSGREVKRTAGEPGLDPENGSLGKHDEALSRRKGVFGGAPHRAIGGGTALGRNDGVIPGLQAVSEDGPARELGTCDEAQREGEAGEQGGYVCEALVERGHHVGLGWIDVCEA